MSAESGQSANPNRSSGSDPTASGDDRGRIRDSSEQEQYEDQRTETLGVLLVHGIGAKRRGDTLVHCTTALHRWLRDWWAGGWYKLPGTVDLVDVSIAEAGPDSTPQARVIFRRGDEISRFSWLLAESSWFETYRRPGFYEFFRWALGWVPIAVIVHFMPPFRRTWRAYTASVDALQTGVLSYPQFLAIKRELGALAASKTINELAQRPFLLACQLKMTLRYMQLGVAMALTFIVGLAVELLLIAVALLAVIPGIPRSVAGWVQRTLSATVGDSYLFVTSPITGAAIVTRVKRDLAWLTARSDRVIVLAHSQGAAVCYRALEQQFLDRHVPPKLNAFITYGSGLRKLFDLENAQRELKFFAVLSVWSTIFSLLVAASALLLLSGVIPWWAAFPGVVLGLLLQVPSLVAASDRSFMDPAALRVPWHNHYSSHDPVPNGPMEVLAPASSFTHALDTLLAEQISSEVSDFNRRQREVANFRSTLWDHTTYWSSQDDFVAGIVEIFSKASEIPIHLTLDEEWLKVSSARRLWRVGWLSRCRIVTGVAALSMFSWPRDALSPAGSYVAKMTAAAMAKLPEELVAWLPNPARAPDWLMGAGGLTLGTCLAFLVAFVGWSGWERKELTRFFHRRPHPPVGLAVWIFALGWSGVLISAPAYAVYELAQARSNWESFFGVLWAPCALAVWTAWTVTKLHRGPGNLLEMGRIALARAEVALSDKKRDRVDALREAAFCFGLSRNWLGVKHSGSDEWVRAVLAETQVVEELARSDPMVAGEAPNIYQTAIEGLKRAGRDASEVQLRLERGGAAQEP